MSTESPIDSDAIAEYKPGTFEPLVGDVFTFPDGTQITLVEVKVHSDLGGEEYRLRLPFSSLFRAPKFAPVASGIRQIRHDSGDFTMAMNPVQVPQKPMTQDDSIYFESVFA